MLCVDMSCSSCPRKFQVSENSGVKRPDEETFNNYLSFFLNDVPDVNCAKAGKAAYSSVSANTKFHYNIITF